MSILDKVGVTGNKFVVPLLGKMFRSNITKHNQALAFCINKGYFEMTSLIGIKDLKKELANFDEIVIVGGIDEIRKKNGKTVYRQRVFFKNLIILLEFCRSFCLNFELSADLKITINNIMNCKSDLKYLERYAALYNETIDNYLKNCLCLNLQMLLDNMDVRYDLGVNIEKIKENRTGYLNRTPFIVTCYNIDNHTSSLYLDPDTSDTRLFSGGNPNKEDISGVYGYTSTLIRQDRKRGVI